MFGPSVVPHLLWPRLTSPRPSQRLSTSVALGSRVDLPGYCAPTFTLMPVGYTPHRSVQVSGFGLFRCLAPMRRLVSASCSSGQRFASGFLRIRSRPRHPCLWLTLPLVGRVEDFHLQVGAPCRAHEKKRGSRSCFLAFRRLRLPYETVSQGYQKVAAVLRIDSTVAMATIKRGSLRPAPHRLSQPAGVKSPTSRDGPSPTGSS
jgi:hypothetical protein